jgi:glycine/D-amino acid oxidase-like deaminating enzyme
MTTQFPDSLWPDSLWADTATQLDPNPALEGDASCDVVVIGAGFTGLRAALQLAEAGSHVIVVDAGDVGWGASGRNGGQVNPMLPFNTPDKLMKLVGPQYFDRLTETSLNSADALFDLIKKYDIDCQARQNGWLRVDHCNQARKVSASNTEIWNRHGADMHLVEGEEVVRLSGSKSYQSGVVAPKGGAVQPLSLARGLARAALACGVIIHGQTPVTGLREAGKGWVVKTATGNVSAEWVVFATNGYTDGLCSGLAESVIPLVSIQIATDPLLPQQIDSILPEGHTISDTRRVIMYSRREPDGRLVFGSVGKFGADEQFGGFDWLVRDARRVFPQLGDFKRGEVNWQFRWGGQLAITEDRLPHFHEPRKGLIAGLGYNGRGVAMSHVMGLTLAQRVLGATPESLPFPSTAIKSMPFRAIQMMGKGSVIQMMRMLDYLESR